MWIILITIIDQLLKHFIWLNKFNFSIIKNFLSITYTQNTGGIFGVFQGNNHIFIMISFVILISLFIYAYKTSKEDNFKFILWQFIIAGGLSNIIDRIFRGFVIDFIAMKPFGIFNNADVCIVISVILMVFIEIKEIAGERNKGTNN